MIIKKLLKQASVVVMGILITATASHAGVWCDSGTVTQTGANPYASQISGAASPYVVYLTCETAGIGGSTWATEKRFVILDDANKDANYATALSAAVSGNPVRLLLMGTTADSLIEIIYVK